MRKKKVLQVAYHSLANGGVQAVIMEIVRNLSEDFDFDIILFTSKKNHYDEEFERYGRIYRIPTREKKNKILNRLEHYYRWIKIFFGTYKIVKNGNYDVIHCHNEFESGICNLVAKLAGVKIRISHAHNSASPKRDPIIKKIYKYIMRKLIAKYSNVKIGCSKAAIQYLYGKNDKDAQVISNAIDLNKFDKEKYPAYNGKTLNFIHVGRFVYSKNQLFLLRVFKKISEKLKHSKLTLVGFGKGVEAIKEEIFKLNLQDSVEILPHDSDIPFLLSRSSYMIFPSRFEGLGIALLEAQIMGVKCFASNAVPPEADLGLITYISLDAGEDAWAQYILEFIKNDNSHKSREVSIEKKNQVDIEHIVKRYKLLYLKTDSS